ncbi:MAG: hypothetical protein HOV94_07595 [Saccharothrix sp.]|nr:hypothetical protein [Saccharothrix sp.]
MRRRGAGTAALVIGLVLALIGATTGSCGGKKVVKVVAEQIRDIALDAFFDQLIGQDRDNLVPGPGHGTLPGDTPGQVGDGSSRIGPLCDVDPLVAFLTDPANSAVAGVWAEEQGIPVAQIGTYLHGLTPVVLRNDTLVTNHNYKDGRAKAYQSLLQAGTVVLEDDRGVPRVKCNCGNPLKPPTAKPGAIKVDIPDPQWAARYQPAQVVAFTPAKQPITRFYLADLDTGGGIYRPSGTTGYRDERAPSPPPPTTGGKPSVAQIAGNWEYPGGDRESYDLPDGTRWEFVLEWQRLDVTRQGSFTLDITAHVSAGPAPGAPIAGQCSGTVSAGSDRFTFTEKEAHVVFQGQEVSTADMGGLGCGDFTATRNADGSTLTVTDATGARYVFTRIAP